MLYRLYVYLGKKLHPLLLPFLRFGKEKRVRVAVIRSDGYILLVRNWFGYQNWSLPGGGSKESEKREDAVVREVYEETGLRVDSSGISYLKPYDCHESPIAFEADVYHTILDDKAYKLSNKKSLEIIESKWHPLERLPKELAMPIQEMLREIKNEH